MIFKRREEIGATVENKQELLDNSEFVLLDEETKKVAASKKKTPKQWTHDTCDVIKQGTIDFYQKTQTYCKDNKFNIWKRFLGLLSIYFIVFTFTLACFPFSYFIPESGTATTLKNFYFYNGSSLTLSGPGIAYIVSLIILIGCWIGHIFMYKKYESNKYSKENAHASKKNMMFYVLKFLSWTCLIAGLFFIFLLIILPPNINQYNTYLQNQEIIGQVKASYDSHTLPSLAENIKKDFLQILGVPMTAGSDIDTLVGKTFTDSYDWMANPAVNFLTFYNVSSGGVSSFSTAGIVVLVFGSIFASFGVISFAIKYVASYFNEDRINNLKEMNINFNFNFNDTKENLESINQKLKGVYANSQQKIQERKNKDSFRKYKKRLIEEGKDTNSDRFTTDVENLNKEQAVKPEDISIFQTFKSAIKESVKKRQIEKQYDNNIATDKKRMKPSKPEIAVPDEELDDIIDSLDIK